jgi:nucleoside 2-deoxyribosyltransferase
MTTNNKPSLYLAGPIFGCTEGEAKDWRAYVTEQLPWVTCISPLRCEPMVGERYDVSYKDPCFGAPKAIVAKNFLDLRQCDMTLAYFPAPPEIDELADTAAFLTQQGFNGHAERLTRIGKKSPQRSIGTIGEVSWAYALRKPCIVVSTDPLIEHHPFTSVQPDWPVLPDLETALRLIRGVWTDYAA